MLLQHTVDLSQSQTDWLQCVEGKSAQKTGIFKDQMSLRGTHGLITCLVQSGKYPFSPSGATIAQNAVLEFRWQICVEGKSAQKTGIFKDRMSLRGTHGLITCLVQSGKYPFSPSGATIVQNTVLEFRRQICVHNSAFHYDRFILQDPTKKDSKRHDLNDSKQF